MKKTIIVLLALGGMASAASIGYSEMSSTQKEGVVMGLDWNGSDSKGALSGGTVANGTLTYSDAPWANVTTGASFTISFDITDLNVSAWQDVLCLASTVNAHPNSDERKLQLQANNDGMLYMYNTGSTLFNGNGDASATNMELGITTTMVAADIYTFTFVSDVTAKTFTGYVNGNQVGQWTNWTSDGGIGGIQFGQRFGGGRSIGENGAFTIDNVTIWDRALDSAAVKAITTTAVPEPTAATLSLLALAGLAARRRRK